MARIEEPTRELPEEGPRGLSLMESDVFASLAIVDEVEAGRCVRRRQGLFDPG